MFTKRVVGGGLLTGLSTFYMFHQHSFQAVHTSPALAKRTYHHATHHWNGKNRVILIGDVHGCAKDLQLLLDKVKFTSESDTLVFVGDLVRKGPESSKVVQMARSLNALSVRGNHDEYAMIDKDNKIGLSKEDLDYLQRTPLTITIPELNVIVVHAGLIPNGSMSLEDMPAHDLMTMRNVDDHTHLPQKQGKAWAKVWKGPQHVVFGHDANRGLQLEEFAIGLDTGCVYGKRLTALILPEGDLISIRSSQPRPYIEKAHL